MRKFIYHPKKIFFELIVMASSKSQRHYFSWECVNILTSNALLPFTLLTFSSTGESFSRSAIAKTVGEKVFELYLVVSLTSFTRVKASLCINQSILLVTFIVGKGFFNQWNLTVLDCNFRIELGKSELGKWKK